jgi:hypothetical protein
VNSTLSTNSTASHLAIRRHTIQKRKSR